MVLSVGAEAPDFQLPAGPGEDPVRLSDYRGEKAVVLLFFPLAFSPTCTEEMCTMAEDYGRWAELGAEVLGISVDSPFVNRRFREETGAPFPILSDFNKEVVGRYGVLREELIGLRGVANRAAFVVGKDGRIAYVWVTENPGDLPPFEEIREAVRRAG